MKHILLVCLLLMSCSDDILKKKYYPFGTGLECDKISRGYNLTVYDCTDLSGNKIDAVYNAVNVMEN